MRWEDEAVVLGFYPLGEAKKVATLLTHSHGRHKGVWRPSKTMHLQSGSLVKAVWSGRLVEHLGTWTFETGPQTFSYFLQNQSLMMAAHGAISLCESLLPEREPAHGVYEAFQYFLCTRTLKAYCYFELALLNQTSFPLDLRKCVFGEDLTNKGYVSPKTGRAVCEKCAGKYIPRLLPLPFFMHNSTVDPSIDDVLMALSLTGYFLERYSLDNQGRGLPHSRQRLIDQLPTLGLV